jgi:hypothetical protein
VEKLKITGWTEHSLPFLSQDQILSSLIVRSAAILLFPFSLSLYLACVQNDLVGIDAGRRFRKAENIFWKIFSICYNIFLFLPISLLLAAEELIGFFLLSLWPIAVPFFWGFFFGSVGSHGPGLDRAFSISNPSFSPPPLTANVSSSHLSHQQKKTARSIRRQLPALFGQKATYTPLPLFPLLLVSFCFIHSKAFYHWRPI